MYIRNSIGPRTVPWGTPERTGWGEDCDPSETTLCDLPCRKCWIQLCVDPLMPYQSSLYSRLNLNSHKYQIVVSNVTKYLLTRTLII